MAKINMAIRGIDADFGPYHADTFGHDLHPNLKADFIMANPPFNYHPWGQENLKNDSRWKYGLPPASNANFAWIQHMLYHLSPNGKIGLVLANGALSTQAGGEGEIRKNIICDDKVECIISLPSQLFYSVTIPVTLWFFNKNKKNKGKVLFIDARKMGFMADRTHRDFSDEDIKVLTDVYEAYEKSALDDIKGFCAVRTISDIGKEDYILTPGRYVGIADSVEDGESFETKMSRLSSKLKESLNRQRKIDEELTSVMKDIQYNTRGTFEDDRTNTLTCPQFAKNCCWQRLIVVSLVRHASDPP